MYYVILLAQDTYTSQKDNLIQQRNASYTTIQATFIITNNHETMIHQHKAHVYIQTAVLSILHVNTVKKKKTKFTKKKILRIKDGEKRQT